MAITLTSAYLEELRKRSNAPDLVLELALDSGTKKYGYAGAFPDVLPVISSVASLQNRLDPKTGYSTRGQMTFEIIGMDNFTSLVSDEYLKNRRVVRKDGFCAPGFTYSDYASTYSGKIVDWSRKGDRLSVTVQDDLVEASKKLPEENDTKTQYIAYQNMNPVDIMTDLLLTRLEISAGLVDSAKFTSEKNNWLQAWKFDRVLTEPKATDEYLNELQVETNSFLIHDGEKISYKVYAPPLPGQTVQAFTDALHIKEGSFSLRSGYRDAFYNRVVIYYDYDESGSDKEENFEAAIIAFDPDSQGSSEWNETTTKVIKSKWIRSLTCTQPSNIGGVILYNLSRNNGIGSGTLNYNSTNKTLTWTPPGGSPGEAVSVTKNGKFQVFGSDKTKYVRVIVISATLPGSNQSDNITISPLSGQSFAETLAEKLLNRYRDPLPIASFEIDINDAAYNSEYIKPTDLKDITSAEACEKGKTSWTGERCMIISVRPDHTQGIVQVEAIPTRMYRRYGFIAPAGYPDYASATSAQRERAYIGRSSDNKVYDGAAYVDGYYIW